MRKSNPRPPRRWVLAPRQVRAIQMLIAGASVAAAARALGVNRRTIFRWLGVSEFRRELDRRLEDQSVAQPPSHPTPPRRPRDPCDDEEEYDPELEAAVARDMARLDQIAADVFKRREMSRNASRGLCENGGTNPPGPHQRGWERPGKGV
jgi:transposase-like protein